MKKTSIVVCLMAFLLCTACKNQARTEEKRMEMDECVKVLMKK